MEEGSSVAWQQITFQGRALLGESLATAHSSTLQDWLTLACLLVFLSACLFFLLILLLVLSYFVSLQLLRISHASLIKCEHAAVQGKKLCNNRSSIFTSFLSFSCSSAGLRQDKDSSRRSVIY